MLLLFLPTEDQKFSLLFSFSFAVVFFPVASFHPNMKESILLHDNDMLVCMCVCILARAKKMQRAAALFNFDEYGKLRSRQNS